MSDLLITGYPGFLASALLPRLLARRATATAYCLVQSRFRDVAASRLDALVADSPGLAGRVVLLSGDITVPGLDLDTGARDRLAGVGEVWHLAAVYDLAVARDFAHRVNVVGTRNVLALCESLPGLERVHYVSTVVVGGAYDGVFHEDELEVGQSLQNHYESTKFLAEADVRAAMRRGLPATVYRPGVVVGDSTTGETQKFDGPYYLARLMLLQRGVAVIPRVADPDTVRFPIVPRDFVVDAMATLSDAPGSLGTTYALTDPEPPTVRELVDRFAALLGRRTVWAPVPLPLARRALEGVPGVERLLGVPAEAVDYFARPTRFDTTNTDRDLLGTGIGCPRFEDYAGVLLDYFRANPDVGSAAMV